MESILSNLKDPSWWFTAVFVAILASVLASIVRDWVPVWLGKSVFLLRKRRYRNLRNLAKKYREAKDDIFIFSGLGFRLIINIIIMLFMMIMSMASGPMTHFYEENPEYDITHFIYDPTIGATLVGSVALLFLFIAVLHIYRMTGDLYVFKRIQWKRKNKYS